MSAPKPIPAVPGSLTSDEEEFLRSLRRSMAGFLAQNLPFSLFQPGRTDELKERIQELVDSKLKERQLEVAPHLHEKLIRDIVSGLPGTTSQAAVTAKIVHTEETLRALTAPYLAHHLSNDLLEPGHEAALARKIVQLVDEKLHADAISIEPDLHRKLIQTICRNMNVPAPEVAPSVPAAQTAVPAASAPSAAIPPQVKKREKNATKKISRVLRSPTGAVQTIGGESEEIPFTDDLKRELLLAIGIGLDPKIMTGGDSAKVRKHILSLMETYCAKHNLELEEEIKDLLVTAILNGEGVEFQL